MCGRFEAARERRSGERVLGQNNQNLAHVKWRGQENAAGPHGVHQRPESAEERRSGERLRRHDRPHLEPPNWPSAPNSCWPHGLCVQFDGVLIYGLRDEDVVIL